MAKRNYSNRRARIAYRSGMTIPKGYTHLEGKKYLNRLDTIRPDSVNSSKEEKKAFRRNRGSFQSDNGSIKKMVERGKVGKGKDGIRDWKHGTNFTSDKPAHNAFKAEKGGRSSIDARAVRAWMAAHPKSRKSPAAIHKLLRKNHYTVAFGPDGHAR